MVWDSFKKMKFSANCFFEGLTWSFFLVKVARGEGTLVRTSPLLNCLCFSSRLPDSSVAWRSRCCKTYKLGFSHSQSKEGNQWARGSTPLKPNSTLNLGLKRKTNIVKYEQHYPSCWFFPWFLLNSFYSLDQKFLVMISNAILCYSFNAEMVKTWVTNKITRDTDFVCTDTLPSKSETNTT